MLGRGSGGKRKGEWWGGEGGVVGRGRGVVGRGGGDERIEAVRESKEGRESIE